MIPQYYKYYIGQTCYHEDGREKVFTACMYDQVVDDIITAPTLKLKKITDITVEESIIVCRIIFPQQSKNNEDLNHLAKTGKRMVLEYFGNGNYCNHAGICSLQDTLTKLFPFLIDRGYNLFNKDILCQHPENLVS